MRETCCCAPINDDILQDLLELLEELYARHFACYNYWGIVIFVVGRCLFP
jgi:hypothetical protein